MTVARPPLSVGSIIALLVLVLAVVFWAIHVLTPLIAGFFIALALARIF